MKKCRQSARVRKQITQTDFFTLANFRETSSLFFSVHSGLFMRIRMEEQGHLAVISVNDKMFWNRKDPLLKEFSISKLTFIAIIILYLVNPVDSPLTYEGPNLITSNPLQCDQCPPGTFLRTRCSSVKQSQCAPCPQGSFTELWNYMERCLRCAVCGRNQVVRKECSADSDCQCECKQGYFYRQDYDMCVRHSECPSGQGAISKEIVPAFFIHHKTKMKRLRRVVNKLPSDDVRKQEGTLELSFSELHSRISSWASSATPMQIRQLLAILIKLRATHAGEKIQKKLNGIYKNLSKLCHLGNDREVDLN